MIYMSNGRRPLAGVTDGPGVTLASCRLDGPRMAEAEARRILAVTEPHVLCGAPLTEATAHGSRGPWNFYYGGRDYRTSAGGDWSAEAGALAESLSSFLAATDPAAYLAAVSQ